MLLYKKNFFYREDVCVRNTIEYSLNYGDARFQEDTANFDRQMESYRGPKYHVKDDEVTEFPVFIVSEKSNKSLKHFNYCSTENIVISNHDREKYE